MPSHQLPTDIHIVDVELYLLPVTTRVPLKFGSETLSSVTCARAKVTVENPAGKRAEGWGETPLSVQWVWPSVESYSSRYDALISFCNKLAVEWKSFDGWGHPIELACEFQASILPDAQTQFNQSRSNDAPLPYLAALVAASVFDQAIHDAYGNCHAIDIYRTYRSEFMSRDLASLISPAPSSGVSFDGLYPNDFLVETPPKSLPVWHLVGGLDPISPEELTGNEPNDGYPVLLDDWIKRDGLDCLKIKLRGTDAEWDLERLKRIGKISLKHNVRYLTADFNCTVRNPEYVNQILDQLQTDHPAISERLIYIEQPFPYELEEHRIDVRSVSRRKLLFLDESAHDWKFVRLGRELGWSGVALKTCKTQTGALLSLCWAKAHQMPLMVQDLTNPMLAQIPHVRLAAHAGTLRGVESNAMQFYPDASNCEAAVHPGLYRRRNGQLNLSTIGGSGFGYRINEIKRELGQPVELR